MKLGLHLSNFTYGVPTAELAAKITEIVVGGEAAGFDRLSVMDHYFQIPHVGPVESEMFEAYSILGYIAAKTSRLKLGVLATGVTYRNPGFLAKQLAGLDVLSCGRAWLGIGAAWFQREHEGLAGPAIHADRDPSEARLLFETRERVLLELLERFVNALRVKTGEPAETCVHLSLLSKLTPFSALCQRPSHVGSKCSLTTSSICSRASLMPARRSDPYGRSVAL